MEHLTGERGTRSVPESVATPEVRHNERPLTPGLPVIVVLGPTATGKSALALDLAQRFNGEVISTDSRYLYRGMNIGTAKPSDDKLRRVPHHLVDIVDPEDDYSLAMFLDDAFDAIEATAARGHRPIVAGGTPLYLRALLQGWSVPRVPPDPELRDELEAMEAGDLHRMVLEVDPVAAERIGPRNKRRLIRALEVHRGSGQPLSELEGKQSPPYRFLIIGLYQEREALYRRIDDRVRWMYENGLLDEARLLIDGGVPEASAAMSAIGYPEARQVVRREMGLDEAIESTCFATHRYVRHQETWFRRFDDVAWLDSSERTLRQTAVRLVEEFLADQPGVTGVPDSDDS